MVQIRTPWVFQDLVEGLDRMNRCSSMAWGGVESLQNRSSSGLQVEDGTARLELDLPGVSTEGLEITLENNRLRIQARRQDERSDSEEVSLRERSYGELTREYRLPWPVKADGVQAQLEQGVLSLTLERSPESAPRQIEVKSL